MNGRKGVKETERQRRTDKRRGERKMEGSVPLCAGSPGHYGTEAGALIKTHHTVQKSKVTVKFGVEQCYNYLI